MSKFFNIVQIVEKYDFQEAPERMRVFDGFTTLKISITRARPEPEITYSGKVVTSIRSVMVFIKIYAGFRIFRSSEIFLLKFKLIRAIEKIQ